MLRLPKTTFKSRLTAGLSLTLLLLAGVAQGNTLVAQPEQLLLSSAKPLSGIQFRNTSGEETTLNFKVVQWQQKGDRESLTPTSKVIVIPDKMTLKPGETGKVRVGLRLSGPRWEEEAFRIMITERTGPPDVGVIPADSASRSTRHSSVPVFLLPPGKASPRVSWNFKRNDEGTVVLSARNNGKGHVRFNSASLLGPAGESLHKPQMTDVLLPGGTRSWEFPTGAAAGAWHLIADTNAGPMRVKLELEADDSSAKALSYIQ